MLRRIFVISIAVNMLCSVGAPTACDHAVKWPMVKIGGDCVPNIYVVYHDQNAPAGISYSNEHATWDNALSKFVLTLDSSSATGVAHIEWHPASVFPRDVNEEHIAGEVQYILNSANTNKEEAHIRLNRDTVWESSAGDNTKINIVWVLLHELGHVAGAGHVADTSAVMWAPASMVDARANDGRIVIQSTDVQASELCYDGTTDDFHSKSWCQDQDSLAITSLTTDGRVAVVLRKSRESDRAVVRGSCSGDVIEEIVFDRTTDGGLATFYFLPYYDKGDKGYIIEEYRDDKLVDYFSESYSELQVFDDLFAFAMSDAIDNSEFVSPGIHPSGRSDVGAHALIVYNRKSWSSLVGFSEADLLPIINQAQEQLGSVRIVGWSAFGGVSAGLVRTWYAQLVQDNNASNSAGYGPYPVNPGPLLIIVGSHYHSGGYVDGRLCVNAYESESEYSGIFLTLMSDLLLTDIDYDGIPNGPTTRLLARNEIDIQRLVDYSNQFQESDHGKSLFVLDDVIWGEYLDHHIHGLGVEFAERGIGNGTVPLVRHTSALGTEALERMQSLVPDIDSGLYELWIAGHANSVMRWARTMAVGHLYSDVVLQTNQAVPIFNISCNGVSPAMGSESTWQRVYEVLASSVASGLKAAVCIAPMGAGNKMQFWSMMNRLGEQRVAMSEGDLYASIVYEAVVASILEDPAAADLYNSFFVFGGLARFRSPGAALSVEERLSGVPAALAVGTVTPNPFNPRTTVWMDLPQSGVANLAIHDLRGRLVRTLWSGQIEAGRHPMLWNGLDDRGRQAASGVYLVRLVMAGEQKVAKITLAK